jgi:hypothetical protein
VVDRRDPTDAVEILGVTPGSGGGERRAPDVEDELFRFSAWSRRRRPARRLARLEASRSWCTAVDGGGAGGAPGVQAAVAPRGLRTGKVPENFVQVAAYRRQQLVAEVISAVPDDEAARAPGGALRDLRPPTG